jgi:TonB-linked SusC/RagA family outer membrane protein
MKKYFKIFIKIQAAAILLFSCCINGWSQDIVPTMLLAKETLPLHSEKIVNITVTGKITDESGQILPGVNISIKGTTKGVASDVDGSYTLTDVPENATLVFSFIGYVGQEIAVNNRTTIDVVLVPDITLLSDVVVVGYGSQKKSSLVAAISTISAKDIALASAPSVEQALQGRAPGVIVTNNGSPGEAPIVRIRGINSINFASNPFYVVDGIPQVGNFTVFDSKDIESVEVLKDANSAAIYGSRAGAGVILITTRKGTRDGKLHVKLDSYTGTQSAWKKLDLLNTEQYIKYGTALLSNAGQNLPGRFTALDQPIYAGTTQTFAQTNTDWQKELFQAAAISQHHVSISGGNDKSRLFVSGGYFNQNGIMKGTGFERYNFRVNSDSKVNKWLTIGQTLLVAYSLQKREQSAGGRTQVQNLLRMTPYIPLYNPTNLGGYGGTTGADGSDPQNPVRAALQDLNQLTNVRILGSVFLEAEITKWLKYRVNVGGDFNTSREYIFQPLYTEGFNSRTQTILGDNRSNYFSPVYTNQLTFDHTFGKHYVNATAVIEYQNFKGVNSNTAGNGLTNSVTQLVGLSNQALTGTTGEAAIYSYIGRLNYEFNNKYLLSASIRRDGASNFAPGKKFGNFPSIGIGWRISEEDFLKDIPAISELKLRGSYGTLGFIPPNYYPWQTTVNVGTTAILGGAPVLGGYYSALGNKDLTWETTQMTNIGLDAGFLGNKITFSAEYYVRNTDNLILSVDPARSLGYSDATSTNIGQMKNWGYEFQASYNGNINSLKFNVSGNIGTVKNKIIALQAPNAVIDRGDNPDFGGTIITRTEVGQPVQSFYGWQTNGIFQNVAEVASSATPNNNTRPGDIRFIDQPGKDGISDGKIDDNDRVYLGSFLPKFTYGLNASANYKGFDLSLFFQGVQGNKIYNGTRVITEGMLRLFNSGTAVLNAWTYENPNNYFPRAVSGDPNGNVRTSNRFIEDGSYLRLKNLTFGYTIPNSFLTNLTKNNLSDFRVYVTTQNLLTFTKYKGYDPEVGSRVNTTLTQGIDYGQFPQARSFVVGLQLGF